MAAEAVQVEGPYEAHDFTVADGAGIPQNTLCQLTSPRTATASSGGTDVWAGIAATEKVASNGVTELGLFTTGIWLLTNSGLAITDGSLVSISGSNLIKSATAGEILTGDVIGKALQDIAPDAQGEVRVGALA